MADNNNPYYQVMTGLSGATSMGMDIYETINQEKNRNPYVSRFEGDGETRPTLSLGNEFGELNSLRETEAGKGLIGRSMATGASTGLGIGAMAGGGVFSAPGAAIGTGIGAVTGLFAGLFGKDAAQRERKDKVDEFGSKIAAEQESFNRANEAFFAQQNQRNVYNTLQRRKEERMYNIPSFNS